MKPRQCEYLLPHEGLIVADIIAQVLAGNHNSGT